MKLSAISVYMSLSLSASAPIVYAQTGQAGSAEQISISITRGRSARLLITHKNGSPQLFDNPVGEHRWSASPSPHQTTLPSAATVLGLPNADGDCATYFKTKESNE
jgi:hypothetical protein